MSKLNVLVIEDEASVQKTYCDLFKEASITCVSSGEEAMREIGQNAAKWDLIISEQRLRGRIPGRDIYNHLVEYHPHLSARFIFITANKDELDGLAIAPGRVVSKPSNKNHLARVARGTIQLYESSEI